MDLLILGASARAAAMSALRIGLRPTCADLFADADLAAVIPATRIEPADYPDGLLTFAAAIRPSAWLYTGALENRPDLIDAISRRHRLLGNPGVVLRSVRDPIALADALRAANLPAIETRLDPTGLPLDGSWLVKPIASAAGRGIRPWTGQSGRGDRPVSYQRRVDGPPMASIHVGDGSGGRFLGLTRQLIGGHGRRFAYRGSVGPWPVAADVLARVERMGAALAAAFGLVGLFGVDFILEGGNAWPVEVNPRYTASVEVLEWALGRSLMAEHLAAFGVGVDPSIHPSPVAACVAKVIDHADRPMVWSVPWPVASPHDFPAIADVPAVGTGFRPGDPVLTRFAAGPTPEACLRSLEAGAIGLKPGC